MSQNSSNSVSYPESLFFPVIHVHENKIFDEQTAIKLYQCRVTEYGFGSGRGLGD